MAGYREVQYTSLLHTPATNSALRLWIKGLQTSPLIVFSIPHSSLRTRGCIKDVSLLVNSKAIDTLEAIGV